MPKLWQSCCLLCTFICISLLSLTSAWETPLVHVQTFTGVVGAENFTYFRLTLKGHVVIKLHSYEGDADLYLSTENLQPTWSDYTMKSDTCSDETVIVQNFEPRPIGIGVYGYVQFPISRFQLSVFIDPKRHDYFAEAESKDDNDFVSSEKSAPTSSPFVEEKEESLLWSVFVGFLKILFEILV